jgi:hypothetical protein
MFELFVTMDGIHTIARERKFKNTKTNGVPILKQNYLQ